MKICGVSHPVPTMFAERIYVNGKTVFVSKSHLGKVSKGDKFIIYESQGARAYTGYADIKFIGEMKPSEVLKQYKDKLMVTSNEFKEYSKGRDKMNVIEFENFKKFTTPIVPKRFVAVSGKYIYEDEFNNIKNQIQ